MIAKTGSSSVLDARTDWPKPTLGPNEVLVEMEYAGVNFVDVYQRTGLYPLWLPSVAGREGAGMVRVIGSAAPAELELHVGDRVAVFHTRHLCRICLC